MVKKVNIQDYVGKRFGSLTVIDESPKTHEHSNQFLLKCDCGNIISEQPNRVIGGHKKTCGRSCKFCKRAQGTKHDFSYFIGEKRGELTVIGIIEKETGETTKKTFLKCECSCGKEVNVLPYQFKGESVKSCGHLRAKAGVADGRSLRNPKLYAIWHQMIERCENKDHKWYYRYGGRGIMVCDEWKDYCNFEKWVESVGGKPDGTSIDRIDNDKGYYPENCRWATQRQQTRNQSRNIMIEFNGKNQSLADWADELGIKWVTLHNRYVRGWSVERMLTEPVHSK